MDYNKIIDSLSLEDLVGQVLCYDISPKDDPEEVIKIINRIKPGGIFLTAMNKERIALYTDAANKVTKVPTIVASDIEHGPETAILNTGFIPHEMAWGACDDPDLIKQAGSITAKICRKNGVSWTYSPVVDVNYNFRNPEINIRSISDNPEQVAKIASAFIDGAEENGYLITTCKHFPGQGRDERNSHFVTTINDMSKDEWRNTYGKIYKKMIDKGIASIMISHGALPSFEDDYDEVLGPPPAVLSYNLMTKLLKEELGFEGCLVSDAMSMIGVCSRVDDLSTLAARFIKAGGDMVLFPEPTDYDNLIKAVKEGYLPIERLKDAVLRILKLKDKARLFENQEKLLSEIEDDLQLSPISQKIADKSVKIVRNLQNVIPAKLKKGSKILLANILEPNYHAQPTNKEYSALIDEFNKNGIQVDSYNNINHTKVKELMPNYDLVLITCNFMPGKYHGATTRVGWNNIFLFWRGYVLAHPKVVFASFGDPYKLFDFPYLKQYINAFSFCDESQRAVAKLILGQIESQGKNPISFKNFFDIEV